jgi:hypothetical protein
MRNDVKEHDNHAVHFAHPMSCLFGIGEFGLSVYSSCSLLQTLI